MVSPYHKFIARLLGLFHRWPGYQTQLHLLLAPYLIGTLLLTALPALVTLVIAFTRYDSVGAPVWVGGDNFIRLFNSVYVRSGLRSSLIFVLAAVPLRLLAALALALFSRQAGRASGWLRTAIYLPTVIPEVAYALIWLWIFNPVTGPLNVILSAVGLPLPDWLAQPTTAVLAFVIMSIFQIGEGFVVVLGSRQNIPQSLYETAMVDGATSWQMFWTITLPLLTPVLILLCFRDLIVSLQATFTPSFVMTYGGPYYATSFAPLMIYELAFDFFDFGLASAALVALYLLLGLIVAEIINLTNSADRITESEAQNGMA